MGKYAIITGVSSGIGECIANNFIEEGIHVFGIDENEIHNEKMLQFSEKIEKLSTEYYRVCYNKEILL